MSIRCSSRPTVQHGGTATTSTFRLLDRVRLLVQSQSTTPAPPPNLLLSVLDSESEDNTLEPVVNTFHARLEKVLIKQCATDLSWESVDNSETEGNIVWLGTAISDSQYVVMGHRFRVINRFPSMQELVRKRWLARILKILGRLQPVEINFFPETFFLPEDLETVRRCLSRSRGPAPLFPTPSAYAALSFRTRRDRGAVYILKPDAGAQGAGLKLVNRIEDIPSNILWGAGGYIVQKYISNPMLLRNKKFDVRVYVLVTKVVPELEAYIGCDSLVRFCTVDYAAPDRSNFDNAYMHYTNFAINKENKGFVQSENVRHPLNSKRHLDDVLRELFQNGYNPASVWSQIIAIVQETVTALQPLLALTYKFTFKDITDKTPRCFQVLGFDILLDDNGRAWLLEVNSNPSLRTIFPSEESGKPSVRIANAQKTFAAALNFSEPVREGVDGIESPIDTLIKYPLVKEALSIVSHRLLQSPITHTEHLQCIEKIGKKNGDYVSKHAVTSHDELHRKKSIPSKSRSNLTKCILSGKVMTSKPLRNNTKSINSKLVISGGPKTVASFRATSKITSERRPLNPSDWALGLEDACVPTPRIFPSHGTTKPRTSCRESVSLSSSRLKPEKKSIVNISKVLDDRNSRLLKKDSLVQTRRDETHGNTHIIARPELSARNKTPGTTREGTSRVSSKHDGVNTAKIVIQDDCFRASTTGFQQPPQSPAYLSHEALKNPDHHSKTAITQNIYPFFSKLHHWMPIAIPLSDRNILEQELAANKNAITGRKALREFCRKLAARGSVTNQVDQSRDDIELNTSKDNNLENQAITYEESLPSCWSFLDQALERHWVSSQNQRRLMSTCRQLFEAATNFPNSALLKLSHWESFSINSGLRKIIANVKVPCLVVLDSAVTTNTLSRSSTAKPKASFPVPMKKATDKVSVSQSRKTILSGETFQLSSSSATTNNSARTVPPPSRRTSAPIGVSNGCTKPASVSGLTRTNMRSIDPSRWFSELPSRSTSTRSLSWPDLKWLYFRPFRSTLQNSQRLGTQDTDQNRGLGFWSFWELLLQIAALIHTADSARERDESLQVKSGSPSVLCTRRSTSRRHSLHDASFTLKSLSPKSEDMDSNLSDEGGIRNDTLGDKRKRNRRLAVCALRILDWWPDTGKILKKVLELDAEALGYTVEHLCIELFKNLETQKDNVQLKRISENNRSTVSEQIESQQLKYQSNDNTKKCLSSIENNKNTNFPLPSSHIDKQLYRPNSDNHFRKRIDCQDDENTSSGSTRPGDE